MGLFVLSLALLVTIYLCVFYVLKQNHQQDWDDKYVDNMAKIAEEENGKQTD